MYWDHGKVNIVMLSAHQDVNECAPTPTKSLQLNRNEGVVIQQKQQVVFLKVTLQCSSQDLPSYVNEMGRLTVSQLRFCLL